MLPWHKVDPARFEEEQGRIREAYPQLTVGVEKGTVWIRGPFILRDDSGIEVDRYEIAIMVPGDYPDSVPTLYETGERVARSADEHCGMDGRICLWVEGEARQHWPSGSSLVEFLAGPVRSFFLAHAHFRVTSRWPWGDRPHGEKGILEFYGEMLETDDREVITAYLEVLARGHPKGHWTCPCGSGKRLRSCHWGAVDELRRRIDLKAGRKALDSVRFAAAARALELAPAGSKRAMREERNLRALAKRLE